MVVLRSLYSFFRQPSSTISVFRPWNTSGFLQAPVYPDIRLKNTACHGMSTLPFKGRKGMNSAKVSMEKSAKAINGALDYLLPDEEKEDPTKTKLMNSVIKVYCKHTEPNFSLPWQRKRQVSSSSSGFLVSQGKEKWVLTNAHSVAYYSQVQVKRRDDDRKFIAKVLAIGTDCDIALLTVEERDFWSGVDSLNLGPLPRLQDFVTVVGYPIGGDSISVTSGVVSRIEMTQYSHGGCELLAVQIDAAINSGNSGGPVFNEAGQCVGIAFQSYADSDVENIGYMIPTPVIQHFLQDYRMNKTFTGFANLGFSWQKLEAPDLRDALGMGDQRSGILVRSIFPTSSTHGVLKSGDVLMKFNDTTIANDGTVPFRIGERIMYNYLISQKFVGDVAQLEVFRDGKRKRLQVELQRYDRLVPAHLNNGEPSFFVLAGVVFTVLNEHYLLSEYGEGYTTDAPVKLLHEMCCGVRERKDQEVVVLSQVLASDATVGFEDICNSMVHEFNGTRVQNLNHLVELVVTCDKDYMRFDLDFEQVVILNTDLAKRSTPGVLEEHSIPDMASHDVMQHLEKIGLLGKNPRC